jgi:hypothetical protein
VRSKPVMVVELAFIFLKPPYAEAEATPVGFLLEL